MSFLLQSVLFQKAGMAETVNFANFVILLHGSPACPRLPPLADSLGDALLHLTLLFMQIKKGQINEGHPGEPLHNAGRENESLDTMCATQTVIGSKEFVFFYHPMGKLLLLSEAALSQ